MQVCTRRWLGAFVAAAAMALVQPTLAARGETPAAFDDRCIPAGCVAARSNIPDILARRALPAGRLGRVGATPVFHHGLPAGQSQRRLQGEAQREQWQKVEEILQAMQVRPGSVVADVGAGDGFFTSRLSTAVGAEGRVLAVDVSADALRRLRARVADEALSNVQVIEGAKDDPRLPAGSLDAALVVNAYHEMVEHQAILAGIRAALKPGGRLVIVEPISASRRDSRREEQTRNHEIAVDFVRADARAAGFRQVALHDPFTQRPQGNDEEWMLVLTAAQAAVSEPAAPATAPSTAQVFSAKNDEWKAPELRISVDEFKRLEASGQVLILDVRDPQSYRQGHLPGAILMTPEELSTEEGQAKLKGETRTIVAYCS